MEDKVRKNKLPWSLKDSGLSLEDQRWIWENLPHTGTNKNEEKNNVSVNGNESGAHKNEVKSESNFSKPKAISELRKCTYKTPPKEVESYLKELFDGWGTKKGHWLYVAQRWTPRAINRVINQIIKRHQRGDETIKNPASYFTELIKYRKKRKKLRSTNGTHKQY